MPSVKAAKYWVRPELAAEARFTEWIPDRRLRHTLFHGLREDKRGWDVVIDQPLELRG